MDGDMYVAWMMMFFIFPFHQ